MALRRIAAAALLALSVAAPARLLAQRRALEYEVKAAYLYNIVNFVMWPPDAFDGPADAVRVCVYGGDPFGPLLDRAMQGGVASQRPMAIARFNDASGLQKCHVVFVAGDNTDRIQQAVRASAQRPLLTIGESPDFLRRGGMIVLVVDAGRVRFDVNQGAAAARGLVLSSRLLQVARAVVGRVQPS